jgi:hypothetical protein
MSLELPALLSICLLFATSGVLGQDLIFTDWTLIDAENNRAEGMLGPVSVLLTGSDIYYYGVTDGTSQNFNYPYFTPQLPTSDYVEFLGSYPSQNFSYSISFSEPVTDPVLHIYSLASSMQFPQASLTKVSGQDTFTVSGSSVSGADAGGKPNDANETIRLNGTFSHFTFSVSRSGGLDGIGIQLGGKPVNANVASIAVSGRVRDFETKKPLADVTVTLAGQTQVTSADGT